MSDELDAMVLSYPDFPHCAIQTFCDDKSRDDAKTMARIFSQEDPTCWSMVEDLNKQGAWVFFSVNSMQPGKRDKKSLTRFNSWICEIDHMTKEEQLKLIDLFPLYPSLIVESCHWFHMYRYIKFPEDMTADRWSKINWWLCNFFSGDPKIPEDTARVLRVPNFYHMKDPANPYLIHIYGWCSLYYTEEQMLSVLTDFRSLSDRQEQSRKFESEAKSDDDNFWARVNAMDSKTMLSAISGSDMVSGDIITFKRNAGNTEQIFCNGRSTSCWIDSNGKIGSYEHGWPHWTNWVAWYGRTSWKELYHWIIDHYPEMKPEQKKEKKSSSVVVDSADIDLEHVVPFTWWVKSLDEKFGKIDYHSFVIALWESGSGKTEFTFFQARQNANAGIKTCYIGLEMNKSKMINRIAMKRAGISKAQWDNKSFSEFQIDKMKCIRDEIWRWNNLDIVSLDNPTAENICQFITEKNKDGYELFFLDNLWFIIGWPRDSELDVTREASRLFKNLTNQLNISLILLHHFNKGNSASRQKLRELSDIRSSWKIENDADLIFQIRRDFTEEDERYSSKVVFSLQKDRNWWTPGIAEIKFVSWDYEEREDPL